MKREKPFLHNLTSLSSLFLNKILTNIIDYQMPWALDNGSQPYRNAFWCFEMAGIELLLFLLPALVVGDIDLILSLAYQQGSVCGCLSHQPFRRT